MFLHLVDAVRDVVRVDLVRQVDPVLESGMFLDVHVAGPTPELHVRDSISELQGHRRITRVADVRVREGIPDLTILTLYAGHCTDQHGNPFAEDLFDVTHADLVVAPNRVFYDVVKPRGGAHVLTVPLVPQENLLDCCKVVGVREKLTVELLVIKHVLLGRKHHGLFDKIHVNNLTTTGRLSTALLGSAHSNRAGILVHALAPVIHLLVDVVWDIPEATLVQLLAVAGRDRDIAIVVERIMLHAAEN